MQVNLDDLLQSHSRWTPERAGSLQMQVCHQSKAKASSSSKADQASACYCRLVGNLLFVSRGIDPVSQDWDHLIVLEACKIDIDYSPTIVPGGEQPAGGYAFRLVFDYESQTVLFRAASEADRSAWVSAIQEASIFNKLESAEFARQRIMDITGQDPMAPPLQEGSGTEAEQAADTDGLSSGAAGGLELSLSCRDLPALRADTQQFPNAHVEVHARAPPLQEDWWFVGRTDIVDNCRDPRFRKLVVLPEGQYNEETTCVRFDVFDVRDQASRTMRQLYTAEASLRQLEATPALQLVTIPGRGGSCVGAPAELPMLFVNMHRRSVDQLGPSKNRHAILLRHLCTEQRLVASHVYKFSRDAIQGSSAEASLESPDQLTVQEFMCDLKCGMNVPLQVATLELARLRSLEAALASLGEHNCPGKHPELRPLYRLSQPDKQLPPLVSALCQEFAACVEETNRHLFDGEFLKLSRRRHNQALAFVPPNLQLHRLAVVDSREKPLDYLDIVSLGAPAAHCMKFKKGGLLTAFKGAQGLEDALDVCEQAAALLHEGAQLSEQLTRLLTGAQQRAVLQPAASAAAVAALSMADAERLNELVNRLIFLASNFLIVQNRIALELPSIGMQQLNRLLFAATADADTQQLMACEQLLAEVNSVWQQCRLTLARLWLSEASKFAPDALLACYRRRVTSFSQMLTAAVCGVAAHFSRWSESAWRQMEACGIPLYQQSLLSAYKSECGMLEDMVATVPRLAAVSVTFFPGSMGDQPVVEENLRRVRICVPQQLWDRLSSSLDSLLRAHSFRLVPVLFSVGINEQQTLAETKRVASLAVQRDVNRRSAAQLKSLVDQVIRFRRSSPPSAAVAASLSPKAASQLFDGHADERSPEQSLRDKMQLVDLCIEEDRSKPVALLHTVEEMFWLLDGVRLTNCKSGKDRTAMAVTLEQARWLREYHRLRSDRSSFESTIAFLRTHGLRRNNCFRNIGTTYYAFNRVQLHAFPQMYRPPKGTYQRGPT